MSPKSDSCRDGPTNKRPFNEDDNDNGNDVEHHVAFDPCKYPDVQKGFNIYIYIYIYVTALFSSSD